MVLFTVRILQNLKKACLLSVVLVATITSGVTSAPADTLNIYDPYEKTNRHTHAFNTTVDSYVIRPASQGYTYVTPGLIQLLVHNGLTHLTLPGVFINSLLSGNLSQAVDIFGRFTINTLMGAGGLLDPATDIGIPNHRADFGTTLASYGVEQGAYIELPFFGPSTVRHTFGRIVDMALSPTAYFGNVIEVSSVVSPSLTAADIMDKRSRNKKTIDYILYGTEDSYASLRSVYLQNRQRVLQQFQGDQEPVKTLPDIYSDPM